MFSDSTAQTLLQNIILKTYHNNNGSILNHVTDHFMAVGSSWARRHGKMFFLLGTCAMNQPRALVTKLTCRNLRGVFDRVHITMYFIGRALQHFLIKILTVRLDDIQL